MDVFCDRIFAGIPPTITLSGTDLLTTALAPIATLFPTTILPYIFAPGPIYNIIPNLRDTVIISDRS